MQPEKNARQQDVSEQTVNSANRIDSIAGNDLNVRDSSLDLNKKEDARLNIATNNSEAQIKVTDYDQSMNDHSKEENMSEDDFDLYSDVDLDSDDVRSGAEESDEDTEGAASVSENEDMGGNDQRAKSNQLVETSILALDGIEEARVKFPDSDRKDLVEQHSGSRTDLKRSRGSIGLKNESVLSKREKLLEKRRKRSRVDKIRDDEKERCKKSRSGGGVTRRNIRNVMQSSDLNSDTLRALKEEEERMKRLGIVVGENDAGSQLLSEEMNCELEDDELKNTSPRDQTIDVIKAQETEKPTVKGKSGISGKNVANELVVLLSDEDDDSSDNLSAGSNQIIHGESFSSDEDDIICISEKRTSQPHLPSSQLTGAGEDYEGETDAEYEGGDGGEPNGEADQSNSNSPGIVSQNRILVNVGHSSEDPDICLSREISRTVKPHQIQGIRFLYANVVENLSRFRESAGFGCILGHSMGLGKTLQVVAFSHLLLTNHICKRILVIVPINTIQNWVSEFSHWTNCDVFDLNVFRSESAKQQQDARKQAVIDTKQQLVNRFEAIVNKVISAPPSHEDEQIVHVLTNMCDDWTDIEFDFPLQGQTFTFASIEAQMQQLYFEPRSENHSESQTKSVGNAIEPAIVFDSNLLPDLDIDADNILTTEVGDTSLDCLPDFEDLFSSLPLAMPRSDGLNAISSQMSRNIETGALVSTPGQVSCAGTEMKPGISHDMNFSCSPLTGRENSTKEIFDEDQYDAILKNKEHVKIEPPQQNSQKTGFGGHNAPDFSNNQELRQTVNFKAEELRPSEQSDSQNEPIAGMDNVIADDAENKETESVQNDKNSEDASSEENGKRASSEFTVYRLSDDCKNNRDRLEVVNKWHSKGGVLLMGYEMFRLLSRLSAAALARTPRNASTYPTATASHKHENHANYTQGDLRTRKEVEEESMKDTELVDRLQQQLLSGPEVVICDEGHRIKNCDSAIAKSLNAIHTRRRVVLTGYPLQNNLVEYWCMVDFVRPNYLGTRQEFCNMFERPISNGQCVDSTPQDIKLMKYRSHVLTSLLRGFVLRRSHSVLIKALPKKTEFIILVRMSPIQKELYSRYLGHIKRPSGEQHGVTQQVKNAGSNSTQFPMQELAGVHNQKRLASNISVHSKVSSVGEATEPPSLNPIRAFGTLCKVWNHPDVLYKAMKEQEAMLSGGGGGGSGKKAFIDYSWAESLMSQYKPENINDGPKLLLLMEIIRLSVSVGEKVLVFSQSLGTLTLVERSLASRTVPHSNRIWQRNRDYFRLDGETSATERGHIINKFNTLQPSSSPDDCDSGGCGWVMLLSTKAGCLGINLVAASRVVIMDVCWNPCHDAQAVCRVFRYGQKRRTFIYRLVANNTMEKRMYDRQLNKQGMSQRIVDELNPQLFLTRDEVEKLLDWEGQETETDVVDHTISLNKYSDHILQEVCSLYYPMISVSPFEHESLLVDNDSKLSVAEKREAREGYQRESQTREVQQLQSSSSSPYSRNYSIPLYNRVGVGGELSGGNDRLISMFQSRRNRPVANIRPFSVRNSAATPHTHIHMQQPWAHLSNRFSSEGTNGDSGYSENQFTLSGDVRIPGNRTYSGQDMVLRAGELVTLTRVKNPSPLNPSSCQFYLKTGNGSVFQMDNSTASSLMRVCARSSNSNSANTSNSLAVNNFLGATGQNMIPMQSSPYEQNGPGHSLFVAEGPGIRTSHLLPQSSANSLRSFNSAYTNRNKPSERTAKVAPRQLIKCNEPKAPPPVIELSDSD